MNPINLKTTLQIIKDMDMNFIGAESHKKNLIHNLFVDFINSVAFCDLGTSDSEELTMLHDQACFIVKELGL